MDTEAAQIIASAIDRHAHTLTVIANEEKLEASRERKTVAKIAAATIESLVITARGHDRIELTADDVRNLTIGAALLRKL